jgi:predicted nuclease with TOPRIM domain
MKSSAKMAIEEAAERVEGLKREAAALEEELKDQTSAITERWEEAVGDLESLPITPRRSDVEVDIIAIAWEPHWLVAYSDTSGARRTRAIRAHEHWTM